MSSSLMSCVRENSPPLAHEDTQNKQPIAIGGQQSLQLARAQEIHGNENFRDKPTIVKSPTVMTENIDGNYDGNTVEVTPPNAEQQKRRRFHMLRNLGRIFRRRTITSINDAPIAAATSAHTRTLPVTRIGTQPTSSTSEKNLRSDTLTSMSSMPSASSPSSPLTHQQLQEVYNSQSLPKSKTYANSTQLQRDVLLLGKSSNSNIGRTQTRHHQQIHQTLQHDSNAETSTDYDISIDEQNASTSSAEMYAATSIQASSSTAYHHHHQRMNQSIGVAVLPPIGGGSGSGGYRSRNFLLERQKLRSFDSSHDLDSGEKESAGNNNTRRFEARNGLQNSTSNSGEITDSQRSLSEGRLVDSDFTREGLSQSHDSVFSESATASSLSIGLRAELADVLRKRRTRPDGSDEDLGLPRSPGSPQRRAEQLGHSNKPTNSAANNNTNQSEVSSMSLLSMTSTECEDFQATSTANNSLIEQHQSTTTTKTSRYVRSATFSSMPTEIVRYPQMRASLNESAKDEVDLSNCQRLSHSAAKHKIAIRPVKKHMPTRQHRRTLETSIPEANETGNINKTGITRMLLDTNENSRDSNANSRNLSDSLLNADVKSKSIILPPKLMEQQAATVKDVTTTASSSTKKSTKTKIANAAHSSNETNKSPMVVSETCESTTKISNMSTKMTAIRSAFTTNKTTPSQEKEVSTLATVETTDSGFLRHLMPRNSKRNYAKANAGNDSDKQIAASGPKKIPISTSCFEMATNNLDTATEKTNVEKVKSAMSYEQSIEETRKVIKREIQNEGTNGLSAILNNFALTSINSSQKATTSSKTKSGPASRQRYMPQDIAIPQQESFESFTMVRNVTKTSPSKSSHPPTDASTSSGHHHHFEKKAKIVGLSAFQQKISRSNDSVVRISASNNSLETMTNDEHNQQAKQRKSVEKSRSFRTYNEEQRYERSSINMPSLPDLTLNLPVPNYTQQFILQEKENLSPPTPSSPPEYLSQDKCASLGFEINDNTLLKPHLSPRAAESTGNMNIGSAHTTTNVVSPYKRNLIVTTSGNKMVNLSPSNSCQATNITEIEQNIDMIVKSPFISVIRKSANLEQVDIKLEDPPIGPQKIETLVLNEKKRPKSFVLVQKTKSEEHINMSPATSALPLRSRLKSNDEAICKDIAIERKSAPLSINSLNSPNSLKLPRRSLTEGENEEEGCAIEKEAKTNDVPEFMKIQLNHVDQARLMGKSNVVLAKNVKEAATPILMAMEKTTSPTSDLNIIITENPIIESEKPLDSESPLKSPTNQIVMHTHSIKKGVNSPTSTVVHTPKNTTKQIMVNTPPTTAVVNTPPTTPNTPPNTPPHVELRAKSENPFTIGNHKLSIQERKRLFMNETAEKPISIKKIEDIRKERKKSLSDEVFRKLSNCGRQNEQSKEKEESEENKKAETESEKKATSPITPPKTLPLNTAVSITPITDSSSNNSPVNDKNETNVVLRKKSFSSNLINNNSQKDDSTPELMKVFARRSLKVKDEDIAALTEKINEKKINVANQPQLQQQQNIDSDKENQSSSEEKLYKLSVDLEQMSSVSKITNNKLQTSTNNRNSVADFRQSPKNSNFFPNNNNNNTTNASISINKSQLPPIKAINGQQRSSISNGVSKLSETSKLLTKTVAETNNNMTTTTTTTITTNNSMFNTKRSPYERQSLNMKTIETINSTSNVSEAPANKSIERSATVGEFKGIHQRRAEWEQRAKEASSK